MYKKEKKRKKERKEKNIIFDIIIAQYAFMYSLRMHNLLFKKASIS